MSAKHDWKTAYRMQRRAQRREEKRLAWFAWARGMAMVRELDTCPELVAYREREAMIERIGSVAGCDINREAYS